jgi:hypothetical protein
MGMGWVKEALAELNAGRIAKVRPLGGSMRGRIESGQCVTLEPISSAIEIQVDDIVLVEWKGNHILHLVTAMEGDQIQIGNNLGKINGWVSASAVRGKVIGVED